MLTRDLGAALAEGEMVAPMTRFCRNMNLMGRRKLFPRCFVAYVRIWLICAQVLIAHPARAQS